MHTDDVTSELVLRAWADVRGGRANTAHALARAFASRPKLAPSQRAAVVNALFGMLHDARKIEFALEREDAREVPNDRSEERAARSDFARYIAWRLLAGDLSTSDAAQRALDIDSERVLRVGGRIEAVSDPVRRFALAHSLPDFLAERLLAEHGEDAGALCDALRERAPLTLRANTLKTSRDALIERLESSGIRARASRFAADGLVLDEHANVFELAEFHAGLFEVQDEASQLAAELVAPPPRGTVVDFCAGAGGKTLAIGARMRNQGRIVVLDPSARRLKELRRRAARAELFNVQPAPGDLSTLRARADRVLADVPCSGLGVLRRKPDIRWRVSADDLERLPREQEAIANRALELVVPGGRLIYATCTLLAGENERLIERLMSRGDLELVKVKEILGAERAAQITDASGTFLKLFPHRHDTDGFFAAVLRRKRA